MQDSTQDEPKSQQSMKKSVLQQSGLKAVQVYAEMSLSKILQLISNNVCEWYAFAWNSEWKDQNKP